MTCQIVTEVYCSIIHVRPIGEFQNVPFTALRPADAGEIHTLSTPRKRARCLADCWVGWCLEDYRMTWVTCEAIVAMEARRSPRTDINLERDDVNLVGTGKGLHWRRNWYIARSRYCTQDLCTTVSYWH